MPDREHIALLQAHLWALRAEVESQVRNLTKVHRELDTLPERGDVRRDAESERLVIDVEQILDANRTIRALCETAVEQARLLKTPAARNGARE